MRYVSLDHLTVLGVAHDDMVRIAADCGYDAISPIVDPAGSGLPVTSLLAGGTAVEQFAQEMRRTGIRFNNADGFPITAGTDVAGLRKLVAASASLGARRLVVLIFDADRSRSRSNFLQLCALAYEYGLGVVLEFTPLSSIGSLDDAVRFIEEAQGCGAGILVDALHLFQSGGTPEDVAAAPPGLIVAAQLCDAPRHASFEEYQYAAMYHRLLPGEGELPLAALLHALPLNASVGLEVPTREAGDRLDIARRRAQAAITALDRVMVEAGLPARRPHCEESAHEWRAS